MKKFDAISLPQAIRSLFELNNYTVEGPTKVHGAEVDLVARPSDPFGVPVFIEATIEYVDNDKYGKDVGKLAMIGEQERHVQRLIVSSEGFSLPVKERAAATRIWTLTYDELFHKFQQFDPYIEARIGTTDHANKLRHLEAIYEEPYFDDKLGRDKATDFLSDWLITGDSSRRWLIITGEYGTGKTALTKVLQYRWLQDYKRDPSRPLPIRIELRDFTRQFDARGLIHHFLDNNHLAHIPAEFVYSMIRDGKIVLLLDGYDEMAQYLHARERRACLEALAELSAGGAKGILTSRPNYFTEREELYVFQTLYSAFKNFRSLDSANVSNFLARERDVDSLLQRFIDRVERVLRDLTREQTEALIGRVLKHDPDGRDAVLRVLARVFRTMDVRDSVSLSGKPVIITYLLDVVEGIKRAATPPAAQSALSETQIYALIIEQLMMRDFARTPDLAPDTRRRFLQKLAIFLSDRQHPTASEADMKDLISQEFKRDLNRLSGESRVALMDQYFANLRSSTTLTSSADRGKDGWKFSHNSLREYLVFEHLLERLETGDLLQTAVPVTDAMRAFAVSLSTAEKSRLLATLARKWMEHTADGGRGQLLCLLFDALLPQFFSNSDGRGACLAAIAGTPPTLNGVRIKGLVFSTEADPANLSRSNFVGAVLEDIELTAANLANSDFSTASLESVSLVNANLTGASFEGALFIDVDVSGAELAGCDFKGIDPQYISIFTENALSPQTRTRLEGLDALGYLKYNGGAVDNIPEVVVLRHHPKFSIVEKIMAKLDEQRIRQRRGLEQRGAAQEDMPFARAFMAFLEKQGWIAPGRRDTVEVTDEGRAVFSRFVTGQIVPDGVVEFLRDAR